MPLTPSSSRRAQIFHTPGGGIFHQAARDVTAMVSAARDAALAALRPIGAGATAMYPTALDQVPGLRPHLCGVEDYPGARDLAARLPTLPSNGGLRANRLRKAERLLQKTLMQQS